MNINEIKIYMKKNKITYQKLSEKSNIPITTLKDIFRGATKNPRIDTMNAIIKALGINETENSMLPSKQIIDERLINELAKDGISTYDLTKLNDTQIKLVANLIKELKNK